MRRAFFLLCWLIGACVGDIGEHALDATPFAVQRVETPLELANARGFADERGGGIFVDSNGNAVRVREDGSRAALENHPGNSAAPERVLRIFPAGPYGALVAAENGLYVAESGWLIEPPWRDALDAQGFSATAVGGDGVTWLAHQQGLFRLADGELSELAVGGKALKDISALAVAPAPDGANAVWFAQGDTLSFARQTARARYEVVDGGLSRASLGSSILALAGVSAAPQSSGELWLITTHGLFQHSADGWRALDTPLAPRELISAGRWVWMRAGNELYRYDADARHWGRATGLMGTPTLLAADASGGAWVRSGDTAFSINAGPVPRVFGLFEGARVYQSDVHVRVQIPVDDDPGSVSFSIDDGGPIERQRKDAQSGMGEAATLSFALGGFNAAGQEQSYSLAGLTRGLHTLTLSARLATGTQSRRVHFDLSAGAAVALSFANDVVPIFEARCAKCHTHGPGHELASYEQWVADKERMVKAVVELRMPADGPLDPTQIQILQRWASGGSAP